MSEDKAFLFGCDICHSSVAHYQSRQMLDRTACAECIHVEDWLRIPRIGIRMVEVVRFVHANPECLKIRAAEFVTKPSVRSLGYGYAIVARCLTANLLDYAVIERGRHVLRLTKLGDKLIRVIDERRMGKADTDQTVHIR